MVDLIGCFKGFGERFICLDVNGLSMGLLNAVEDIIMGEDPTDPDDAVHGPLIGFAIVGFGVVSIAGIALVGNHHRPNAPAYKAPAQQELAPRESYLLQEKAALTESFPTGKLYMTSIDQKVRF